jgi:hypothetical protein
MAEVLLLKQPPAFQVCSSISYPYFVDFIYKHTYQSKDYNASANAQTTVFK